MLALHLPDDRIPIELVDSSHEDFFGCNHSYFWRYSEFIDGISEEELAHQKEILFRYINSDESLLKAPIKIIVECEKKKAPLNTMYEPHDKHYILLTEDYQFNQFTEMRNILSLPRALFLLHLLETNRIPLMFPINEDDENHIAQQLHLFDMRLSESHDIQSLHRLQETGFLRESIAKPLAEDKAMQKVIRRSKI